MSSTNKPSRFPRLRFAVLSVIGTTTLLTLVFWPAGRVDWVAGWAYVGLLFAGWAVSMLLLRRKNPELIKRRMSVGKGTKAWDRPILGVLRLAIFGAVIVAGFDAVRYEWTQMSPWLWPLGAALNTAGYAILIWAMVSNTHFEGTVRIQEDRDHQVIDSGPYRYVRHPGYIGFLLVTAAIPFLLGSWWAFPLVALGALCMVLRTALEDRTLRRELEGYAAYAARVRHRLVPGLW